MGITLDNWETMGTEKPFFASLTSSMCIFSTYSLLMSIRIPNWYMLIGMMLWYPFLIGLIYTYGFGFINWKIMIPLTCISVPIIYNLDVAQALGFVLPWHIATENVIVGAVFSIPIYLLISKVVDL